MSTPTKKHLHPRHGLCSLHLRINGKSYRCRPVPVDGVEVYKLFTLTSLEGQTYNVAMTPEGHTCECADFVYSRDGLDPTGCKHIKAMMALGILDEC
jgi:hypothetical protein